MANSSHTQINIIDLTKSDDEYVNMHVCESVKSTQFCRKRKPVKRYSDDGTCASKWKGPSIVRLTSDLIDKYEFPDEKSEIEYIEI